MTVGVVGNELDLHFLKSRFSGIMMGVCPMGMRGCSSCLIRKGVSHVIFFYEFHQYCQDHCMPFGVGELKLSFLNWSFSDPIARDILSC